MFLLFYGRSGLLAASLFLFVGVLAAQADDSVQTASESPRWHRLMHYRKPLFGKLRSDVDGPEFFFHPNGKYDPNAELRATIEAFQKRSPLVSPRKFLPQCAFPARARFVREVLGEKYAPRTSCPDFESWHANFRAESASIIFASAFLNNPASMFGHTFLKINSLPPVGSKTSHGILDYGVNYAANTGGDGGISFAYKGIFGGYPGQFSILPYYEKLIEYQDNEQRDLWEYKLTLSKPAIDLMIEHIWELGLTYLDYFFFDENCSFHILSLLEVAEPKWDLTSGFRFMTLPAQTIRRLMQEKNSVKEVTLRPALTKELEASLSVLTKEEHDAFSRNRRSVFNESLQAIPAATLDSLLLDWKLKEMENREELVAQEAQVKHELLVERANRDAMPRPMPEIHSTTRPDASRGNSKISLYGGGSSRSSERSYMGFKFRPLYHDLLDSDEGFLPWSEIRFLETDLRLPLSPSKNMRLESLTFLSIQALTPRTEVVKKLSWQAGLELHRPETWDGTDRTLALQGSVGPGLAWALDQRQNWVAYSYMILGVDSLGSLSPAVRPSFALPLGTLVRTVFSSKLSLSITPSFSLSMTAEHRLHSLASIDWAVPLSGAPPFGFRLQSQYEQTREHSVGRLQAALEAYF